MSWSGWNDVVVFFSCFLCVDQAGLALGDECH